ncbi:MAG: hypothetical protein IKI76_02935 [Selenomonadaceae bacterium]|nr:hypothetical protein [Selenomonadaceae bacterium]
MNELEELRHRLRLQEIRTSELEELYTNLKKFVQYGFVAVAISLIILAR